MNDKKNNNLQRSTIRERKKLQHKKHDTDNNKKSNQIRRRGKLWKSFTFFLALNSIKCWCGGGAWMYPLIWLKGTYHWHAIMTTEISYNWSLRQQQHNYTTQANFIQFEQKHKKSSWNVYRKSNNTRKKPTHSILPHKLKAALRKSILDEITERGKCHRKSYNVWVTNVVINYGDGVEGQRDNNKKNVSSFSLLPWNENMIYRIRWKRKRFVSCWIVYVKRIPLYLCKTRCFRKISKQNKRKPRFCCARHCRWWKKGSKCSWNEWRNLNAMMHNVKWRDIERYIEYWYIVRHWMKRQ